MSDFNCLNVFIKLMNRHWVDKDINELLEKLTKFVEENY